MQPHMADVPHPKTLAERDQDIASGFNPYACNWCEALLADDPDPSIATKWICSRCVIRGERVRKRVGVEIEA